MLLLFVGGVFFVLNTRKSANSSKYQVQTVQIAGQKIQAYVADTEAKRELGLAAFDRLNADQGMIFYFDQPGVYPIWMKNMKFAIDIIWIRDGKIIDIDTNVEPQTGVSDNKLTRYYPAADIDTVLEVPAGWCRNTQIKSGDIVN